MNNLLLFMSLSGTAAFGGYYLLKLIFRERLTPGFRYLFLKAVMVFYLTPLPLLSKQIRSWIGTCLQDEMLANGYLWGKNCLHLGRGKFYYVIDGSARLPDYRTVFWFLMVVWSLMTGIYAANFISRKRKLKTFRRIAVGECISVSPYLDGAYEKIFRKHRVTVLFLPAGGEAFTYGFFSPVIALPADMCRETAACVLKHELTHIKHRDIWVNFFAYLCVTIHFFNPFIYWFYKELMQTAELHCDEQILKNADRKERLWYGHLLVEQACRASGGGLGLGFSRQKKKELKERLSMIKKKPAKRLSVFLVSAIVVLVMGTVPVLGYVNPEPLVDVEYEEVDYWEISEGDIEIPDDEKMFSFTDNYGITESGEIIRGQINDQIRINCKHKYINTKRKSHKSLKAGKCEVRTYKCVECMKCKDLKSKVLNDTHIYEKCPH